MLHYFTSADDLEIKHIKKLITAAENGDLEAKYTLGAYIDMGDFGPPNKKVASQIFKDLADQGHAHCLWIHASELLWGRGSFPQSIENGTRYLDLAIENGSAEACISKARLHLLGELGFEQNTILADKFRALARELDETVMDPLGSKAYVKRIQLSLQNDDA